LAEFDDGERSVAATFHVSYREVPPDQQRMFALLALHKGPDIDAYGAAALAGIGLRQAEHLLHRLHDAHLLGQEEPGRYRVHDQVRVFATEPAVPPPPEQNAAIRRMLDYAVSTANAADALLSPHRYRPSFDLPATTRSFSDHAEAVAWFGAEWRNLVSLCRTSLVYELYTRCWQLVFLLRGYFFLTKLWEPWDETHRLAMEAARALGDQRAEAMTLNNIGLAHIDRGDHEKAAACYRDALVLFRVAGDRQGTNNCLVNQAWVHHFRGDHLAALRDMWQALDFYQAEGAEWNAAITLRGIAVMQVESGAISHAARHATQSLTVFRRLGTALDAAMALNCLAKAHLKAGRRTRAAACYREAITMSEKCGSRYEAARAEFGLGQVAAAAGRQAEAEEHWSRAERRYPDLTRSHGHFGNPS
jgi:tetratricopeptide (TPR) repeat protein